MPEAKRVILADELILFFLLLESEGVVAKANHYKLAFLFDGMVYRGLFPYIFSRPQS